MANTDGLNMPLLTPGLSGHVPHNDALIVLDEIVGRGVLSATHDAPSTPANWDMHIVWEGKSTTTVGNAFVGNANKIAIRYNGAWRFVTPKHGLRVYNRLDNTVWVFGSSTWSVMGAGQACYAGRNVSGTMTTTSATFAQMEVDTDDVLPSNSITNEGAGVGDIRVWTAGSYLVEWSGQIQSASNSSELEFGVSVSSAANQIGATANTLRRVSFTSGQYLSVHFAAVVSVAAGYYVAPLWRRISGSGTPTQTSSLQTFRITKLNP